MIKKQGSKYVLKSQKGKTLGSFKTRAEAQKRERQIQYFKHNVSASVPRLNEVAWGGCFALIKKEITN